jgi:hypothetical protein
MAYKVEKDLPGLTTKAHRVEAAANGGWCMRELGCSAR